MQDAVSGPFKIRQQQWVRKTTKGGVQESFCLLSVSQTTLDQEIGKKLAYVKLAFQSLRLLPGTGFVLPALLRMHIGKVDEY
jgi:hypothetical protein